MKKDQSSEPVDAPSKVQAKRVIDKFEKMKGLRSTWENHWQEVAVFTLPRKSDILVKNTPGTKRGQNIFDSTAINANELLAGALHGMLTNPATRWFSLTTADDETNSLSEVAKWLDKCTDKMHQVLNNSNFQTEIHEVYVDQGCFGTSAMSIEEDDETVVRFNTRPLSEVYVEENNKGVIDTVYRSFQWNARQIAQEFGEEALTDKLKKALESDPTTQFTIIHAVEPRDNFQDVQKSGKAGPVSWPIASYHVIADEKAMLKESGFKEMPYVVPRWTKISGESFGRSPAMKCLADIKMVNKMMETTIKAAQKTIDPPLMVPDDGFIMPLKTHPGGINYYRSGTQDRIEPFANQGKVDFGYQAVEDVRKRIRSAFYVDQLQLDQGPQMTATEVLQRTEEKMRLMGPVLGRQQSELLRPMIDRIFGIMLRKKLIPMPIPQVLQGQKLQVNYTSLISKSQKTSEGQNITRTVETISPFLQADATIMDNFDGDDIARYVASIYGVPAKLLKDEDEVKKIRAGRAQAQQQQQQAMQQQQQADTIAKVAPAAAKAKDSGLM